jgi:gliding motility-associated protein GldL
MKSVSLFFETTKGKYVKNFIIGIGASIVLIGALGKIQHWAIGGPLLTAGMLTEAFIFAMLGLLPPHKDYYWEKIYPGLDEKAALTKSPVPRTACLLWQLSIK